MGNETNNQIVESSSSWITLDSWAARDNFLSENNDFSKRDESFSEQFKLLENRLEPKEGNSVRETRNVIEYDDLLTNENHGRRSNRRSGRNQSRFNNSAEHGKHLKLTLIRYFSYLLYIVVSSIHL